MDEMFAMISRMNRQAVAALNTVELPRDVEHLLLRSAAHADSVGLTHLRRIEGDALRILHRYSFPR